MAVNASTVGPPNTIPVVNAVARLLWVNCQEQALSVSIDQ